MNKQHFRGVAAVEAAVCLPVVFIIVFGAIEISSGIFQQHVLRSAVHETSKIATRGESTLTACQAICGEILEQRGFPETFSATLEIVERGNAAMGTNVNAGTVPPDNSNVAAGFPVTFTNSSAPTTPIDLPRGTILRLTITTPRPALAGTLTPNILPGNVTSTSIFVKGL